MDHGNHTPLPHSSVQTDEHFLMVARYVERNAVRAGLVGRRNTGSGRVCGGYRGRMKSHLKF